jgi:hypothetical protein
MKRLDLTGQQFGRLTVVGVAPGRRRNDGTLRSFSRCRCACGSQEIEVSTCALRAGTRKSCGCLHLECTPVLERILYRIAYDHGCWTWTTGTTPAGYATINVRGKTFYVHRFMYELERGPIPPGLELDHLCRNRACCNPLHLEAVSRSENIVRGILPIQNTARRRTRCPLGHALSGDNLYIKPKTGQRICRCCQAAKKKKDCCLRGHALIADNVRIRLNGQRVCLTCDRAYRARRGFK